MIDTFRGCPTHTGGMSYQYITIGNKPCLDDP